MLAELNAYYQSKGISAVHFNCPFYKVCSRSSPDTFTTAKEAFVSSGYVEHEVPRVLFLSLDSGSADHNPKRKTLEAVRIQEEIDQNVFSLPKHKHWYRTHELAFRILRHFKPGLTIQDTKRYFAHTNSAKCCMNNPGRAQANSILFENCRRFIPGEIEILEPDVLITQGAYALQAVQLAFQYPDQKLLIDDVDALPDEVRLIKVTNKPVIWIHTFHPRNPGSKLNRDNYPIYEKIIYEFICKKPLLIEKQNNENVDTRRKKVQYEKDRILKTDSIKEQINKGDELMENCTGKYIWLAEDPPTPEGISPSREECLKFEYMKMSQFCKIAEITKIGGSKACNAFGGDKGKYSVVSERMARAVCHNTQARKFVLTTAAVAYFQEHGIMEW